MAERRRRSIAAKKGWQTRREHQKQKNKPRDMWRSTWGTGLSDKNVPYSFTFYAFSKKPLDNQDLAKCEDKFIILIDRWMRRQYPSRNYRYASAEADGWIKTIVRSEENNSVNYDREFFEKWSFEIDHREEERGDLADIV